jgi:hypothetical protein
MLWKGGKCFMNVRKILSVVAIIVPTVIATVITEWRTDKEIEERVNEAIAQREKES